MKKNRSLFLVACIVGAFILIGLLSQTAVANRATVPEWSQSEISDDIAYFLFQSPAKIERYDLATESWMTPISLTDKTETPTAFTVDGDGLYIGFGRYASRFNLDGSNESWLHNTATDIQSLHIISDILYLNHSSYPNGIFTSVNKNSGSFIDSITSLYDVLRGVSVAPTKGKLIGRDTGLSPSEIVMFNVNADGTFGSTAESPYHGDYPSASKTFMFPDESRVVDDSGTVYNTDDLTYSNSFAGKVDDITFFGNLPIILRDNTLIAYSNTLLESGRLTPEDHSPKKLYFKDDTIYSFYHSESRGVEVVDIGIDQLTSEQPGEPVDPEGLLYEPDTILMGNGEIVYILSKAHLSIFRWSVSDREYLETIPLVNAPNFMTFSAVNNRLYLAYSSGVITQISPDISTNETPFVNSPQTPCGLAMAGQYIFVCDPSGAWVSHFTYSQDGTLISQEDWNYRSDEYVWSQANSKMYFFRDDTSPNDLLWEEIDADGQIGTSKDSPYHSSAGIQHPIRVAPDGSIVLLGSGRIYDSLSLEQINSLSNDIEDAAWHADTLYSVRDIGVDVQIQKWGANYALDDTAKLPGDSIRMLPIGQGLLVIQDFYGLPHFTILDSNLDSLFSSSTISGLSATTNSPVFYGKSVFFSSDLDWSVGPLTYLWDYGDGNTGSASDTSHVYSNIGTYPITLTVSNPLETLTKTIEVEILEVPISGLTAENSSPAEVDSPINLSATVDEGSFVNYTWDLGDGTKGITGSDVDHTYTEIGFYTAIVTASNSVSVMTATTTIEVTNLVTPIMQILPSNLVFTTFENETPEPQTVLIENIGTGTFEWSIDENPNWLELSQQNGTDSDVVTVSIDMADVSVGTYSTTLQVTSFDADNGIELLPVNLTVLPQPQILLTATSSAEEINLEWEVINSEESFTYKVYRLNNSTSQYAEIGSTSGLSFDDDDPSLVKGIIYCYRVEGSNKTSAIKLNSDVMCLALEETTLWIPNVSAKNGQIAIVPVNIANGDGLRIAASDIWLEFDNEILKPVDVSTTPLTLGYNWSYAVESTGIQNLSRMRIGAFSNQSPQLYGEGSLFWIAFEVLGDPAQSSTLDLKEFISGVGGSTIYSPDNLVTPIALNLNDGNLLVSDGFSLGDMNGNGAIETVDALIAMQIAIGKNEPSEEQRQAGDINGNGAVDIGDATMIFYYAVNQEWPPVSEESVRSSETPAETVTIRLNEVSGKPGGLVNLKLRVENISDLSGAQFRLVYDKDVVEEITEVKVESLFSSFIIDYFDDVEAGAVQIGTMSLTPYSGSDAFISISLRIKSDAVDGSESQIVFDELLLTDLLGRDFENSAIQAEIVKESGILNIDSNAPETPETTQEFIYLPIITNR